MNPEVLVKVAVSELVAIAVLGTILWGLWTNWGFGSVRQPYGS